jgi:hypothetical protein
MRVQTLRPALAQPPYAQVPITYYTGVQAPNRVQCLILHSTETLRISHQQENLPPAPIVAPTKGYRRISTLRLAVAAETALVIKSRSVSPEAAPRWLSDISTMASSLTLTALALALMAVTITASRMLPELPETIPNKRVFAVQGTVRGSAKPSGGGPGGPKATCNQASSTNPIVSLPSVLV